MDSRSAAAPILIALAFGFAANEHPLFAQQINSAETVVPKVAVTDLAAPEEAARSKIVESYGRLPLSFEINQGQTDKQVKFLSRGGAYTLFLTSDEAIFMPRSNNLTGGRATRASLRNPRKQAANEVLRLKLFKANPAVKVSASDELPGKDNYFIGRNRESWRSEVPTYAKVKYEDVYPGVDLVYYGTQRHLEYDFVVAPKADPRRIQLDIRGARHVSRSARGDLVIRMAGGEVRWLKPFVYQIKDGLRHNLEGHYVVRGNRVGFEVSGFDHDRPLIIDPSLAYSTFLGGSGGDYGSSIAVDAAGNAYITGSAGSSNFPTTSGAFQTACAGGCANFDAFVTKLNPSGSALVYSTYLGGSSYDGGNGIAVDAAGDAFVTGFTQSTDFPVTTGAFQTTCGGTCVQNGFVTELNATGSALLYSTYLGGSGTYGDSAKGVAVDASGDAYVTGTTTSADFPVTTGAFQTSYPGAVCGRPGLCGTNSFVTKLNPVGSALVYSTYLGGSVNDNGYGIAIDTLGDAYVAGSTQSTNFPVTTGAFQTVCNACSIVGGAPVLTNAFIAELNPAGSAPVYSTYLGGTGSDVGGDAAYGIAVDASADAYVTGLTQSRDFPTTSGAFQTTCPTNSNSGGCTENAFVTKLNSSGSALVYSTYVGDPTLQYASPSEANAIAIDATGNTYLTGFTSSAHFPTTTNAFQSACIMDPDGGCNGGAFMTKLNSAGSALLYSSYLMGIGEDVFMLPVGYGIAVGAGGDAYVTGETEDSDFPVTPGAFQTTCGSCGINPNAFVTKFSFVLLSPASLNFGNQTVGTTSKSQTITFTNGSSTTVSSIVVSIAGTNASDFGQTNNCGSSLAAGASCNINITFTPSATGSRSANVNVADDATNSPQTAALSGTGTSAVTLAPSSLDFSSQTVGITSSPQSVTLTNTGNAALAITSISITGTNGSDFAQTNNCPASVPANGSCTINVTFTPAALGSFSASLTVSDNAYGSPQVASLNGSGSGPIITLSPSTVTFSAQYVGTTGLPQTVTVTNSGNSAATITNVTTTPTDFGTVNACGSSVAAGQSCGIGVFFDPTTSGTRTGTLGVTDNAGGSPQMVTLSGAGQDFSVAASGSSSATVTPGQTASYTVSIAPAGGFNKAVALSCSGAPALSACTLSANSVTLNGSSASSVTLTVTTTASLAGLSRPAGLPSADHDRVAFWLAWSCLPGLALVVIWGGSLRKQRGAAIGALLLLCLFSVGTMSACGSSGSGKTGGGGTTAGTYSLTVTGAFTSGSTNLTHAAKLTLIVQ